MLLCGRSVATAQNNPFKIDDELYKYFVKVQQNLSDPKSLLMADTLFNMAGKKHDQKAQCLALHMKVDYYAGKRNLEKLKEELENTQRFARKTPHKQYIFSAWNRLITYYINTGMIPMALSEIRKFQKEAIALDEPYGIGNSYRKLADIYATQHNYPLAIKELENAAEYLKANGKESDVFDIYHSMAVIYASQDKDKAIKYALMSIKYNQTEYSVCRSYILLAKLYTEKNDLAEAQKYIDKIEEWKKKYKFSRNNAYNYQSMLVKYAIKNKEFAKAKKLAETLPQTGDSKQTLVYLYEELGEMEKAWNIYSQRVKEELSHLNSEQENAIAQYSALFENERMKKEKDELAIINSELNIERLKAHDKIVMSEKERSRLQLENQQLALDSQKIYMASNKADYERLKSDAERREAELQSERQSNMLKLQKEQQTKANLYGLGGLLAIMIIGLSIYSYDRRKTSRRLKEEMNNVKQAHDEAEHQRQIAEVARQEAVQFSAVKSQFLENMSHEIRSPLNAIVGFTDILNDESFQLEGAERKEIMNSIHSNTDMLTTLLNDILDLSSLESGYKLKKSLCSANDICREAVAAVKGRQKSGVEMMFDRPDSDLTIDVDDKRVKQVLINFLTNACKNTDKGSITLGYHTFMDELIFTVTDTGVGIPKEKADQIFQRFTKLNFTKQGTGLGLNICMSIAKVMDGRIGLDKEYTDGARFLFALPDTVIKTKKENV